MFHNHSAAAVLLAGTLLAPIPARAQVDLAGQWQDLYHEEWEERIPGPEVADYLGVPLSDAGRAKADSWEASVQTLPERQCIAHGSQYSLWGPANIKISPEVDRISGRIIAWVIYGTFGRATRTIWMDGRPHPSVYAPHTYGGFSTGVWEGNTLTAYTTHMKMNYIRRNGIPASDEAVMTEHYTRHGDYLTVTFVVEDPVYLTEPYMKSASWRLTPSQEILPTPCEPVVEVPRPKGAVPHYLPGKNPFLDEVSRMYNIPIEAVRGGAETSLPEYRRKLKDKYVAPAKCERFCCGWGAPPNGATPLEGCITGEGRQNR